MAQSNSDAFYQVVGQNNRNILVQSKRLAPYHEDKSRVNVFEPSSVKPGDRTSIKLDMKHAMDREIILNDIRLQFQLDFSARATVGPVHAIRGTDLIRELTVKINEDVVFTCNRRFDLSFLWEMNNHKMDGAPDNTYGAYLLNAGNIPAGRPNYLTYKTADNSWYSSVVSGVETGHTASSAFTLEQATTPGLERHDGLPRLIYSDVTSPSYMFQFNISLNQLIGPILTRLHLRRVEFIQIEIVFEPFLSAADTQKLLLFEMDPVAAGVVHPYSVAKYTNIQIQQYRSTLLDGVSGFTLPDNRLLSWLMHRYTRREYTFDFTKGYIDINLNDFEIRTNIVRVLWMWEPFNTHTTASENGFQGFGFGNSFKNLDTYFGAELKWKNDSVLDLDKTFDAYRHYIQSDNKRYNFNDPYVRYNRLRKPPASSPEVMMSSNTQTVNECDGAIRNYVGCNLTATAGTDFDSTKLAIGSFRYEFPVYHLDLNMNIQQGAPGAEVVGGIVNDTSDYVLRIKKISDQIPQQITGTRTLYVMLEYQTLVNLAANSNQFRRDSQIITKQLNPQS